MIFLNMEITVHEKEIKLLEKEKLHWVAKSKCYADFTEILRQNKCVGDLLGRELDILLLWHQIPNSKWGDKNKKMAKWMELKVKKPPFLLLGQMQMRKSCWK